MIIQLSIPNTRCNYGAFRGSDDNVPFQKAPPIHVDPYQVLDPVTQRTGARFIGDLFRGEVCDLHLGPIKRSFMEEAGSRGQFESTECCSGLIFQSSNSGIGPFFGRDSRNTQKDFAQKEWRAEILGRFRTVQTHGWLILWLLILFPYSSKYL